MSLTDHVEADRRRAFGRLLLLGAVVVALVVAVGVVAATVLGGDDPATTPGSGGGSTTTTASPEPTDTATETTPDKTPGSAGIWTAPPVSAGPLIAPPAAKTVRKIPVGYPHTTEGAISAAAHYAEATVTLQVDRARAVARAAAAPSYLQAVDDFTANAQTARRNLGIAATGPTRGAFLIYQSQGYLVRDAAPDRADVWILGIAEGAGPATGGQSQGGPSIARFRMVWVDGDWKFTDGGGKTPQAPQPGSAEAYDEGWRDLALA